MKKAKIVFMISVMASIFSCFFAAYGMEEKSIVSVFTPEVDCPTFQDVKEDSWYFEAVKDSCEKGILTSINEKTFAPDKNLTAAQIVTIAARMHASFEGNTIAENSGDWFSPYFAYAKSANLLPEEYSEKDGLLKKEATREVIAYIFKRALPCESFPKINERALSDLSSVSAAYQKEVSIMNQTGIIGGMEDGKFHGEKSATRAEVATMIMRMTTPVERLCYDPAYNHDMLGQEGNKKGNKISGPFFTMAYDDSGLYLSENQGEKAEIQKVSANGNKIQTIYTISGSYVSIDELQKSGKYLYFKQDKQGYGIKDISQSIIRLNTLTNAAETVFESKSVIGEYIVYGDRIYFVADEISLTNITYQLFEIKNGQTRKILEEKNTRILNLHCFQNKLFFCTTKGTYKSSFDLYQIDLNSGNKKQILGNISSGTYVANTAYYSEMGSNTIRKCSLIEPESQKIVGITRYEKWSDIERISVVKGQIYVAFRDEWGIFHVDNGVVKLYTTLQENLSFFSVYREYIFYKIGSSGEGRILVTKQDLEKSQTVTLERWVADGQKIVAKAPEPSVPKQEPITSAGKADVSVTKGSSTKKLTAEQIYQKCAPAVFYIEVYDKQGNAFASGSGFFINSTGTFITNFHVVEGSYGAKIYLTDGREFWAEKVLAVDSKKDIAILQVKGKDFSYLPFGDSAKIAGGQKIYTIGSPLGLSNTISDGLISNPQRKINKNVVRIQISAPISHGSSGGALIDEYGNVIGITSGGLTEGENLNLAIPINEVYSLMK